MAWSGSPDRDRSYKRRYDDDLYEDRLWESDYHDNFQREQNPETRHRSSEKAWEPLPEWPSEEEFYCPDCEADLWDEDCDHEDDWT